MQAAILGCGPAGLFAAHALVSLGHGVVIYSRKRRSEMFGAQYLHRPIPGLNNTEPITIDYRLQGTIDGYRTKVYSHLNPPSAVSPESMVGQHLAWDIREAYYNAWDKYAEAIVDVDRIDYGWFMERDLNKHFHVVISSIPAHHLCRAKAAHEFKSTYILAVGDAPERGIWVPEWFSCPESTVLCNGEPDVPWYRKSNIYGYRTVEWPRWRWDPRGRGVPEGADFAATVQKPIRTDCNCLKHKVVRIGRYGKWQKDYLSHQAYYNTYERLSGA